MGLPWIRLDTNVAANDKIADLVEEFGAKGKAAGFVYFCALAYSGGHESDGLIKRSALKFVHGTPADASLLVRADLWLEAEGGWLIKNYGTRQLVGAQQQVISAARSAAGKKGAESRWADE